MHVRPDPLPCGQLVGLVTVADHDVVNIRRGETVGYYCLECCQSDETREQIIHSTDCSAAGSHGREVYGTRLEDALDMTTGEELRPGTTFTVLRWSENRKPLGIYKDAAVAFRCDGCANLDETLFQIQHDQLCECASDGEKASSHKRERVAADGGSL